MCHSSQKPTLDPVDGGHDSSAKLNGSLSETFFHKIHSTMLLIIRCTSLIHHQTPTHKTLNPIGIENIFCCLISSRGRICHLESAQLFGHLKHCSDGGIFPSDVEGMHKSTDGFPVKSIRIYSYPRCLYLLTAVRSWPSQAKCSLLMSQTVFSESPVASAVHFTTAILLMVNLHALSFSKKGRTFSTICLVCDLSLTPFLPGVRATLCSIELLELPAPSVDFLFCPISMYHRTKKALKKLTKK